ncbi:BgTH12-01154 [Blumeria graminis f. sp. triticale]|uniref:BgTH12-01154 n=1 Tax=Blumeria graminis f. sp. triticale TaxID=1689686 RepID=A0A9W4DPM5_BLUGR|nr:BgTH12-01154 [Blumeria graminis f. sp. triticale]
MSDPRGKLCGLLRSKSFTDKRQDNTYGRKKVKSRKPRRDSFDDIYNDIYIPYTNPTPLRRRNQVQSVQSTSTHRRVKHSIEEVSAKVWPPLGSTGSDSLSPLKAKALIATGAVTFVGHKLPITHAGKDFYHLFATLSGQTIDENDGRTDMFVHSASLRLLGLGMSKYPWETLEQPSMAFCYGSMPGTVRLNHWINLSSQVYQEDKLCDTSVKLREITLDTIIDQLSHLESELAGNTQSHQTRNIYKILLHPPSKRQGSQNTTGMQIYDLVRALSRHEWIDFSQSENQVVAQFFIDKTLSEKQISKPFFHQLLIAIELEMRIQRFGEEVKLEILRNLPEKVKWDLALAKRWQKNVRIDNFKKSGKFDLFNIHLLQKKQQFHDLYTFAEALKWPNLSSIELLTADWFLEVSDLSEHALSYLSSVILPGPTLPFLLMKSLLSFDNSLAYPTLDLLTHLSPNSGFQYKGTTYWTSNCILGKVLAPTCKEIGGWIGPACSAEGLDPTQAAQIFQQEAKRRLKAVDVETMNERSLPLGPVAKTYPISDYMIVEPNLDPDSFVNNIRIEKLKLRLISSPKAKVESHKSVPDNFDACIQFAVDGTSWPLRLRFNVMFINAASCKGGPHPLFIDYEYKIIPIDDILCMGDWKNQDHEDEYSARLGGNDENVLVIESFGIADNEVLARAWCAHEGISALVADVSKTCMSCAIREAFAACLDVLILVDRSSSYHENE